MRFLFTAHGTVEHRRSGRRSGFGRALGPPHGGVVALIVRPLAAVVEDQMLHYSAHQVGGAAARVVLDDRSRLPWRFFGRFTTSLQLRRA
ncbi:hypothetical protein DB459_09835 [Bradyrhizobium sp. WD16]|nr:hypothetical protein DB459_09835 [Bradyrhizobium sp. WD16]